MQLLIVSNMDVQMSALRGRWTLEEKMDAMLALV
jgi:hypothetical protein